MLPRLLRRDVWRVEEGTEQRLECILMGTYSLLAVRYGKHSQSVGVSNVIDSDKTVGN